MNHKLRTLSQSFLLAFFFVFGLVYVHGAWNEPTQNPPNGNSETPLNVGSVAQTKSGDLTLGGALQVTGTADMQDIIASNIAATGNLGVVGYMKVGEASVVCDGTMGGAIRYDSINNEMQYCNTAEWVEMASTSSTVFTGGDEPTPLYSGAHTDEECLAAGGLTTPYNSEYYCRFVQASCPAGWTKYQNLSTTQSNSCYGNTCGVGSSCSTGGHAFSNVAREYCSYTRDYMGQSGGRNPVPECRSMGSDVCYAILTSVGCY